MEHKQQSEEEGDEAGSPEQTPQGGPAGQQSAVDTPAGRRGDGGGGGGIEDDQLFKDSTSQAPGRTESDSTEQEGSTQEEEEESIAPRPSYETHEQHNYKDRVPPPTSLTSAPPSAQYQLVFGMDDTSSEASATPGSPRYLGAAPLRHSSEQSHDLFNTAGSASGDVDEGSCDPAVEDSLASELKSSTNDRKDSTADETVSTYSDSTLVAESTASTPGQEEHSEDVETQHRNPEINLPNAPPPDLQPGDDDSSQSRPPDLQPGDDDSSQSRPPDLQPGDDGDSSQSRPSSSESDPPLPHKPKIHPLSIQTSDSEAIETPPYSPVPYISGDEDGGSESGNVFRTNSPLPPGLDSPCSLEDQPSMSILFSGIAYLGSSSVDAPVSEPEANRKMYILKQQAESTEPIPVTLAIPSNNEGTVVVRDPETDQPLATFRVKMILFCARGNAEALMDCFCLNVRHKRSGMYHCHVFRCGIPEACRKIFDAIGNAFKTKPSGSLTSLTSDELVADFAVSVTILEEDGKAGFQHVPTTDKDCFKLRQNTKKKVLLTISQPGSARILLVERCFGLLISPGKGVKHSEMNLLDNMKCETQESVFTVAGIWESGVPFLASLNEETPKGVRYQYLTVAADLVLESVTEPVRFKREVKVHVSKGSSLVFQLSNLAKKKHMVDPAETFTLTLKKSAEDSSAKKVVYTVVELKRAQEKLPEPPLVSSGAKTVAPSERTPPPSSSRGGEPAHVIRAREQDEHEDSDNLEEGEGDEVLVSGWGEVDDFGMEQLKDWQEVLDKWDGKEPQRPSRLVKLCRKGVPKHLRCQVWQMLSGATHDPQLLEAYRLLLGKESPNENVINWDIKRTYLGHDMFQEENWKKALYNICKAYSVYDEEVGYCQGFSFMAAVLLLQKMPEEQAFSVLVKIMFTYGQRDLFKSNFKDLHLMFYQLDRLLEEHLSELFQHFQTQRIETHMFASQWFLTLYTAKFPLSIVYRILDLYLCERVSVVFRVALSLLKSCRKELLALDFEGILNYFRVSLPRKFIPEEECKQLFRNISSYNQVTEKKLSKLQKDYQSFLDQQAQLEDPVKRLERENKQLRDTILRLEQENDNLAQELVASKVTLRTEMDRLEERIDTLSKEARAQKTSAEASHMLTNEVKEELLQAKQEYQRVMMELVEERQRHDLAISEYKLVFRQLDEGHQKQKEELNQELLEVKAQLGTVPTGKEGAPDHLSSLSSEGRLRALELELAQTKLALVESQCKNQELEHKVDELHSAHSKQGVFSAMRNTWKK